MESDDILKRQEELLGWIAVSFDCVVPSFRKGKRNSRGNGLSF
jgi:hypothetical protein